MPWNLPARTSRRLRDESFAVPVGLFRSRANDSIASTPFFFCSNRFTDSNVGRYLFIDCYETMTLCEGQETYDNICAMSGSLCGASDGAYASKLIPGYTTRGVLGIEGICRLNTLTVKLEFARIVSACSTGEVRNAS